MKLYSYVVTHDTGFAPNPFFGYCSLACCKPSIRRTAKKDDWIVGLTPRAKESRIVYFMRVDEVLESFDAYWADRRFGVKKPSSADGDRGKCGDNIYEPLVSGGYRQLHSRHSNKATENEANKKHDVGGVRVLISETFAYFGSKSLPLPTALKDLVVARGHRCKFSEDLKLEFLRFTETVKLGVHGVPERWPKDDASWIIGCGCKPRGKQ